MSSFPSASAPLPGALDLPPLPAHAPEADLGDPRALRGVLGRFATGVTVLTAGRDVPCGMTANSFTSVSLEPAQVLVCVVKSAAIHATVLAEGSFAVSVLARDQEWVARHFADSRRPRGLREFEGIGHRRGHYTGAPVLDDVQAWLECRLGDVHEGGDHTIFVGTVLGAGRSAGGDPLLYHGGGFARLAG
ncbi:flavin reductase family protein [Kitasatospora sp. CB01950]|uniref:flavin reductase family protein n=1 Tax=Kitasatospora sp. CB01950 TaxID=1703930 RepID=UPI0009F82B3E|nr:flavin reductase family protein [Kitasatospora sp. CB01950]